MQTFSKILVILGFLGAVSPAHARSPLTCESLFSQEGENAASPAVEALLSGTHRLVGRKGHSGEIWEDTVNLSRVKLEGIETRSTGFPREGASLDVYVRLPERANDIFAVPLGGHMDALSFLAAEKLNLPIHLTYDKNAVGFVVRGGAQRETTSNSINKEMISIGQDWQVVGLVSSRTSRPEDSQVTLYVRDAKTKKVYQIRSRTMLQGHMILEDLARTGQATLVIEGNSFGLVPRGRPFALAPRGRRLTQIKKTVIIEERVDETFNASDLRADIFGERRSRSRRII